MLSQITIICRPTKDPELQTDKNGTLYTRVDAAVNKGYGEKEHVNYYTGWIKGDEAQRFLRAGVKKGSLIYLAGDLDAKAWLSRDGKPGISLNIDVKDWGYASPGKAKDETAQSAGQQPAQQPVQTYAQPAYTSMGTPPEMQAQFEELGDDDELPF